MTNMLPPEQVRWLEAQVASGRFASLEEAIQLAVSGMMTLDEGASALSDAERAAIDQALAEIQREGYATDEEVEAAYRSFGS